MRSKDKKLTQKQKEEKQKLASKHYRSPYCWYDKESKPHPFEDMNFESSGFCGRTGDG